jgi:hypothetical protein
MKCGRVELEEDCGIGWLKKDPWKEGRGANTGGSKFGGTNTGGSKFGSKDAEPIRTLDLERSKEIPY